MTTQLATFLQDALGPDFRIEQELDGGGMSRVFLATDLRHDRRVVVKVLSHELASETSSARFKREIELTVRLQHPHILPILTSGARDDMLYYVSPFIPGESLRARIARDGKLPFADVVKFLRDVSGALAFAHQRGIVHRDVKPGNILLAEGHAILADFGIARAVATSATPLTGSGMVPGTPAYMAPELPTDEKADIYALGVVAYEMLCGVLPKRGVTAKEIVAARGKVAGDSRARLAELADAVAAALSVSAGTRLPSAEAFHARIENAVPRSTSARRAVVTVAAIAAAIVVAAVIWIRARNTPLNPEAYAVLALGAPDSLESDLVGRVNDALSEWRGILPLDPSETAAAVRRRSGSMTLADAADVARGLGARNLIAFTARRDADSIEVRATLYDAARDSALHITRVTYAAEALPATRAMAVRRLVNAMVRDGDELPWATAGDQSHPIAAAWREYDAGRAAIHRWDLAVAESSFRRATGLDPELGLAQLWLAQTIAWLPARGSASEQRAAARRAMESRTPMSSRDSIVSAALYALAGGDYRGACDLFRRAVSLDSNDVSGWIGLGDCQAQNHVIVRDARSPSGWVFSSSYEGAARAYLRAAELSSTGAGGEFDGWLLGRLSGVLYTVPNKLRLGRGLAPDTINFAAYPYLAGDTLAFIPHPLSELATAGEPVAGIQAAVARNRSLLKRAAEDWVRRAPQSAAAYDSLASWMEVSGGAATVGEQQVSTIDVARRALLLSRDSTQRLRLSIVIVRLLVKDGDFDAARAAADSLLRSGVARRNGTLPGVAGLAALVGHIDETARLLPLADADHRVHLASGALITPAPQLVDAMSRLTVYASFAVPRDSVRAAARHTLELVNSYFTDSMQAKQVQAALIVTPMSFVLPDGADIVAPLDRSPDLTAEALRAFSRGDIPDARRRLAQLRAMTTGKSPGLNIDGNLRRARLALLLADTSTALRELDPALRALPTLASSLLNEVPQVTSLVRALALRADLADRAGDRPTAVQCASAVATLWRDADAPLQPLVVRMKRLAARAS